jgi:hypothetical protein
LPRHMRKLCKPRLAPSFFAAKLTQAILHR